MNSAEDISKLSNKKNVVLDFYADWCGPCKNFAKVLTTIEDDPKLSDIDLIKINVDKYQVLMKKFEVRSLPTIVFVKKNKSGEYECVHKKIGSMDGKTFIETVGKTYE